MRKLFCLLLLLTAMTGLAMAEELPVGCEPGMLAPDFTLPLYGAEEETFTLSAHRGRTVVLNFWATWCGPCCRELPCFDALQLAHPEEVTVLAVHSDLVTEDVAAYLSDFEYGILFGQDETGEVIAAFGGSLTLPQTIVIDGNGVIVYNRVGSVTLEALEALLPASAP